MEFNKKFIKLRDFSLHASEKFPNRIAIKTPNQEITYKDLNTLICKATNALYRMGIKKNDRVLIWTKKSIECIALLHAISEIGAVYVPIDIQVPFNSVLDVYNNCQAKLMIVEDLKNLSYSHSNPYLIEDLTNLLKKTQDTTMRYIHSNENDLAYILFTSGSTGEPKGVCLSHKNALAFINWSNQLIQPTPKDCFASHASFSFGISVLDLYLPSLNGSALLLIPETLLLIANKMWEFVEKNQVSIWYSVPSALVYLANSPKLCKSLSKQLKIVLYAGEPMDIQTALLLKTNLQKTRLINFYGNTETNVCSYFEITSESLNAYQIIPIGQPASYAKLTIEPFLNSDNFNEGELLVEGPSVMLGYWGSEFKKNNIYHTKDHVKSTPDGNFHFLGRMDNVIKFKGYRISPIEIESILSKLNSIEHALVFKESHNNNEKLIACITLKKNFNDSNTNLKELRDYLSEHLPSYKNINAFYIFDEMPKNQNGKISRTLAWEKYTQLKKINKFK